jgi:prepilin-type processing-associated H-X9-DG protein
MPTSARNRLHSVAFMFNYLFADGHVKKHKTMETALPDDGVTKWWTASDLDD